MKLLLSFFACAVLALAGYLVIFDRALTAPPVGKSQDLASNYDQFVRALAEAGDFV